jgi:hypothetical protein
MDVTQLSQAHQHVTHISNGKAERLRESKLEHFAADRFTGVTLKSQKANAGTGNGGHMEDLRFGNRYSDKKDKLTKIITLGQLFWVRLSGEVLFMESQQIERDIVGKYLPSQITSKNT